MINLLPPKYKEKLAKEKNFKVTVALNVLLFVFIIIMAGIFFLTKVSLEEQLKAEKSIFEETQKQKKIEEAKNLEEEIERFNKDIAELKKYYQKYFNVSEVVESFSSTLPQKTYVNSLLINRGEKGNIIGEIKAQGYCPNRKTLRSFDSNLSQEEKFTEISFDKKDWTQPVEINFSLNLKIKQSFNQDQK